MKYVRITLMMLTAISVCVVVWAQINNADKNPMQIAYLTVDGKEHEIVVGEEARISIGDKEHSVIIALDPYCLFQNAGLKFKFPSRMYYSIDESTPNLTLWSIDGDNAVIMVQRYKIPVSEAIILESIKNQYLQMKATVELEDIKFKGAKTVLDGKRMKAEWGDTSIYQELYFMKMKGSTVLLIFQDTLDEHGENSREFADLIKTVSASLALIE